MKLTFATALTLAAFLSACATTKPVVEKEPADPDPAYFVEREAAIEAMRRNFERVHFEFDSVQLTEDTREALADNVELMRRFRDLGLEVEGHCDEQGSTEYNLALGQRRAEAIRKYMVTAGIAGFRISTISFGEEQPYVEANGDKAHAFNRRAEFRITIDPTHNTGGSVASLRN